MSIKFANRDQQISVSQLERNDLYAKRFPDITGNKWDEFIASLKTDGQQDNIAIIKNRDRYEVVDGYQRWRAAVHLGWSTIKADIIAGSWAILDEKERLAFCDSRNKHRRHQKFTDKVNSYKSGVSGRGRKIKSAESALLKNPNISAKNDNIFSDDAKIAAQAAGYSSPRRAQEDVKLFDATIPEVHDAIEKKTVTKEEAKEIGKLPKSEQADALARAIADEPITPEAEPEKLIVLDGLSKPVPESLHDVFSQVPEWNKAMRLTSELKSVIKKLTEHKAAGYLDLDDTERLLKQVRANLRFAMPHTECPKCKRKLQKDCKACKGTGWIHESMYRSCASDADKKWLEART